MRDIRGVTVQLGTPEMHVKGEQKQKLPCSVAMIGPDRTLHREGGNQAMTRKSTSGVFRLGGAGREASDSHRGRARLSSQILRAGKGLREIYDNRLHSGHCLSLGLPMCSDVSSWEVYALEQLVPALLLGRSSHMDSQLASFGISAQDLSYPGELQICWPSRSQLTFLK